MAAMRIVRESPSQVELGIPIAQRLPNLFNLVIVLIVGYSFLSPLLSNGLSDDPVSALVLIFVAFFALRTISSLLITTTITIDGSARLATRTRSLLGFPLGHVEQRLETVKRVVVGSRAPVAFNQPRTRGGWLVWLEPTEGAPFIINWNGSHDEMLPFGTKVSAVSGKPLTDELEQAKTDMQTAPQYQPIQDFGGAGSTSYAPPVALPSPLGRTPAASQLPDQSPPPNILTLDSESADHARFEQEASQPAPASSGNVAMPEAPPTPAYMAPPALELPNQAPIEDLAPPPTPIPSVVSAMDQVETPAPTRARTLEELQKAIADDPTDSVAFYQLARILQSRGASDQALSMYQSAVRLDPMNGAFQNDLGVLYFQRGKMKEAELALRRAVGLDPFSVPSHYNLGLLLARIGKRQDAEQEFNRVQQNASSDQERQLAQSALKGRMADPILSPSE